MSTLGAGEVGAAGTPSAAAGTSASAPEGAITREDLRAILAAVESLSTRMGDLEDAVAEALEELGKVRKAVSELKHSAATRKQVKKLKKVLDQLEVIEVGPEDAPAPPGRE